MAVERGARASWEGDLLEGSGRLRLNSGAMDELGVTWASRTEDPGGKTSPEELIAAAHAACFSMALSHGLSESGKEPQRLDVSASCALDKAEAGWRITSMHLDVTGKVPDLEASDFEKAAEAAKEGCPVSIALAGNVDVSVTAKLE